jgi:hypothetical protein
MSVMIFFSVSNNIFFCRKDVQAIDFLRNGSYAPVFVLIKMSDCCLVPSKQYFSYILARICHISMR